MYHLFEAGKVAAAWLIIPLLYGFLWTLADSILSVSVHPSQPIIASGGMKDDRSIRLWHEVAVEDTSN
jgi:hypothetical protein